jgi:hypothetical protein
MARLACRLLAVWLLVGFASTWSVQWFVALSSLFSASHYTLWEVLALGAYPLVQLAIGLALWFFAGTLARWMTAREKPPLACGMLNVESFLPAALIAIGVYTLLGQLRALSQYLYYFAVYPDEFESWLRTDLKWRAELVAGVAMTAVAAGLIWKARTVAAWALRPPKPASEGDESSAEGVGPTQDHAGPPG